MCCFNRTCKAVYLLIRRMGFHKYSVENELNLNPVAQIVNIHLYVKADHERARTTLGVSRNNKKRNNKLWLCVLSSTGTKYYITDKFLDEYRYWK